MRKIATVILYTVFFLYVVTPIISAEEISPGDDFSFGDIREYIPKEVLEELPEDLFSAQGTDTADEVHKLLDVKEIFSFIISLFTSLLPGMLSGMAAIIGTVILASVFRTLSSSLKNDASSAAVNLAVGVVTVLLLFSSQQSIFEAVKRYLDKLIFFMSGMIPMMGGIYILGGNVSSAAVHNGTTSLLLTITESGTAYVLMPVLRVCFGFILITTLSCGNVRLDGMIRAVKTVYTAILGVITVVLVTILASRNIIASAGDTFAMRTAKFAVGNIIPVVGGTISDSLGTLSAGLTLIKNGAGVLGIVLIIFITLPMIVTLLCNSMVLGFSSFVADVLGCDNEKKILSDCRELSGFALGLCTLSAVIFIFSVVVFVNTGLAVSGG